MTPSAAAAGAASAPAITNAIAALRALRALRSLSWPSCLKINLCAHLEESRLQHRGRRQPGRGRGRERLVVSQHRRAVEDVVDVDADVGPPAAEAEVLGEPQVQLVDAV